MTLSPKIKTLAVQIIRYTVWGVAAAAVNFAFYILFTRTHLMRTVPSNIWAWFISNLFSFWCNQVLVFNRRPRRKNNTAGSNSSVTQPDGNSAESASSRPTWFSILKALIIFLASRALSGGAETLSLFFFHDRLGINDIIVKIAAGFIIGAANYLIGKFFIFRPGR